MTEVRPGMGAGSVLGDIMRVLLLTFSIRCCLQANGPRVARESTEDHISAVLRRQTHYGEFCVLICIPQFLNTSPQDKGDIVTPSSISAAIEKGIDDAVIVDAAATMHTAGTDTVSTTVLIQTSA